MYIKPVPGRQVPDPDRSDILPSEGREVVLHQYWQRRLNDGDVVEPTQRGADPVAKSKE
jgi:hypothetical protein